MIFFCEDCGGRIPFEPTEMKVKPARVKCRACNFINRISWPDNADTTRLTDARQNKTKKKRR